MQPFRTLAATACALPLANVDTDQLIPARFMKRTRAEGYGDVFADTDYNRGVVHPD